MSMISRDGIDPDSAFEDPPGDDGLDSAMASGTDAGQPGGHLGPGDLAPDEERPVSYTHLTLPTTERV